MSWGHSALSQSQRSYRKKTSFDIKSVKLVENFLLYLSKMENKPYLPEGLDYKTAITDYLREMSNFVKDTLRTRWSDIDFYKNVLIILQVLKNFHYLFCLYKIIFFCDFIGSS